MKESRGFTLLELAVVLAVIAVLAAVLTPLVTGYIDQARIARAQGDVNAISAAIQRVKTDTGVYPIYTTYANAVAGTDTTGSEKEFLVSEGEDPTNFTFSATAAMCGAATGVGGAGAVEDCGLMETHLNTNILALAEANVAGRVAYRGPYMSGLAAVADPWNKRYIVVAGGLATVQVTSGPPTTTSATRDHAFVVSAGPNQILNTDVTQDSDSVFAISSDDIAVRIR